MKHPAPTPSDRLVDLGGTHHGHVVALPVSPDVHEHSPRSKPSIRLVMDRFQVRKVLEGKKDRHVRLWHRDDPEEGHAAPGSRLPVQKPASATVCHVLVTEVEMRLLGELDRDEARRHGFDSTYEYKRSFLAAHDPSWRRLGKDAIAAKSIAEVEARWDDRWADLSAWVYTFTYDALQDERWVAAGAGTETPAAEDSDAGRGYTRNPTRALDPDAPAVDNAALEVFATENRDRHLERRATETAEALVKRTATEDDIVARFAETVVVARANGIDPRHQIRMVGRALENLERAIRADQAAREDAA